MIYELTKAATQALREAGIPRQSLAPPSGPYLHRFLTAKITAHAELAATSPGQRFISSGEIARHPRFPEETLRAPNPLAVRVSGGVVIPDALYGIDYGGKFRFFAIEADRGTEAIFGHGQGSSHIRGKVERYIAMLNTHAYKRAWGVPVLTVRFVSEQSNRSKNISVAIEKIVSSEIRTLFEVSTTAR